MADHMFCPYKISGMLRIIDALNLIFNAIDLLIFKVDIFSKYNFF